MGFYRKLVAHCDGEDRTGGGCLTALVMDPNTTQPYRDLVELGWTIVDGEKLLCPKTHRDLS